MSSGLMSLHSPAPAGGDAELISCSLSFMLWMPAGTGRNFFFIEAAAPLYPGVMCKTLHVQVRGLWDGSTSSEIPECFLQDWSEVLLIIWASLCLCCNYM